MFSRKLKEENDRLGRTQSIDSIMNQELTESNTSKPYIPQSVPSCTVTPSRYRIHYEHVQRRRNLAKFQHDHGDIIHLNNYIKKQL
jgi:hypothetical protein